MSDVVTQNAKALELAEVWEEQAQGVERFDPEHPAARALRSCAEELRETIEGTSPRWVSLSAVQARTGWSRAWLRKRCQELEEHGLARKEGGEWEMALPAARQVPRKDDGPDLEGAEDLGEMARLLGREGSE